MNNIITQKLVFPDEILFKFFYYVCENCVEEYLTLGMVSKRFYNLSRFFFGILIQKKTKIRESSH